MAPRKTTKKKTTKKAPARRPRARRAPARRVYRRACPGNTARTAAGGCTTRVPCMDDDGNPMPYATRGSDGRCRIKACGAGSIMNPRTGKCMSTRTPEGARLALAKKADDAERFLASYQRAASEAGFADSDKTYYDSFDPTRFQRERMEEMRKRRDDIARRSRAAELKSVRAEHVDRQNRSFLDSIRRNMSKLGPESGGQRQSGGSSFSFFG